MVVKREERHFVKRKQKDAKANAMQSVKQKVKNLKVAVKRVITDAK